MTQIQTQLRTLTLKQYLNKNYSRLVATHFDRYMEISYAVLLVASILYFCLFPDQFAPLFKSKIGIAIIMSVFLAWSFLSYNLFWITCHKKIARDLIDKKEKEIIELELALMSDTTYEFYQSITSIEAKRMALLMYANAGNTFFGKIEDIQKKDDSEIHKVYQKDFLDTIKQLRINTFQEIKDIEYEISTLKAYVDNIKN